MLGKTKLASVKRVNQPKKNDNFCVFVWNPENDTIYWSKGSNDFFKFDIEQNIQNQKSYQNLLSLEPTEKRTAWVKGCENRDVLESYYIFSSYEKRVLRETLICQYCPTTNTKQIYGVVHDVDESSAVKEIEKEYSLKYYDTMNSVGLEECLSEVIVHSNQTQTSSAYLLIEISNFFEICDTDGSESSVQLVQLVKDKLLNHLRQSDIIGYYGDGQFGVILRDITQKPLREIASRLINAISGLNISNIDFPLQVNILGTAIPKELTTVENLKMTTQHAMHRSRVLGVNQYFYSAESSLDCNEKSYILKCVTEGRIELAFQPVIESNNHNRINFYECLARIFDETDNLIPAFEFVSTIENMGLIHILDREVLKKAFAILSNNKELTISINLTSDSVSDEAWMTNYKMLSQKNPNSATRLIVEVTERLAITDFEKTAIFLNTLRNYGTKVAIDDFGAGFTSFQYIRDLPIDILKIDGSYIKDISNNKNNQILVKTITSLAKEFDIKVVAEFVETVEEAELLTSFGIDYLQGYLFGRPELGLPD